MDKPAMVNWLEANIEAFICEMLTDMLQRVRENWIQLMNHLLRIYLNFS